MTRDGRNFEIDHSILSIRIPVQMLYFTTVHLFSKWNSNKIQLKVYLGSEHKKISQNWYERLAKIELLPSRIELRASPTSKLR